MKYKEIPNPKMDRAFREYLLAHVNRCIKTLEEERARIEKELAQMGAAGDLPLGPPGSLHQTGSKDG